MHRLLPQIILAIILFIITSTFVPVTSPPVQAQIDDGACGVSHYDISDGSNYVFLGNRIHSPCPLICPPHQPDAAAGHYSDDINSPVAQYWCAGTPRPPDKPAVNAGQICLPGDSRTVTLSPSGGNSHQIEINPGGVVSLGNNTSHTFTGLQHNTAYRFRGQSSDSGGSSGWSDWTPLVYQDLRPPTTTVDAVGITGNNGWYTSDVNIALFGNDDGCLGVAGTFYSLNGGNAAGTNLTITAEGTNTLAVYSTDGHNAEIPHNHTIRIDKTPPSVSVSPDRLPDVGSGWWTAPVTLTVTASDAVSGLASQDYTLDDATWQSASNPITLSADGIYNFDVRAIDMAGWTIFDGVVIQIDQTPPELSITTDRANDGDNGWWRGDVTVSIHASDATSGIQDTVYSLDGGATWLTYSGAFTISRNGTNTVHAVTRDHAENVTTAQLSIPIDKQLPHVEIEITGQRGQGIWYAEPPIFRASATDGVSGLEGVYMSWGGAMTRYLGPFQITDEGEHRFTYFARDFSGNQSATQTITFGIDLTPPQIANVTLDCNANSITVSAQISDSRSGLWQMGLVVDGESVTSTVYDTPVVNQSIPLEQTISRTEGDIILWALDAAGHETQATVSCTDAYAVAIVSAPYGTWPDDFLPMPFFIPPSNKPTTLPTFDPSTVLPNAEIWRGEDGQIIVTSPVFFDPSTVLPGMEIWADDMPMGSSPTSTVIIPNMIVWADDTPQVSASSEASTETLPLDESGISGALAAMAALATVGAGVVATASSRRRQDEAEQLRAEQEVALGDALADQQAKVEANLAENVAKQEAAQGIAYVQAAMSDWMKMYLDLVAGYGDRVRLWQEAVAREQASKQQNQSGLHLPPGSKIQDLPKELQDIFWALGNLHYQQDKNGDWLFDDATRRNLGYYQYLIRDALNQGDVQGLMNHLGKASTLMNVVVNDYRNTQQQLIATTTPSPSVTGKIVAKVTQADEEPTPTPTPNTSLGWTRFATMLRDFVLSLTPTPSATRTPLPMTPLGFFNATPTPEPTLTPERLSDLRLWGRPIFNSFPFDLNNPDIVDYLFDPGSGRGARLFGIGDGTNDSGYHLGIDLFVPHGTPILSISDGIVVATLTADQRWPIWQTLAPEDYDSNRNAVMIRSGYVFVMYEHMDEVNVAPGQQVLSGQPIGTVGIYRQPNDNPPGYGDHLHLEVRTYSPQGITLNSLTQILDLDSGGIFSSNRADPAPEISHNPILFGDSTFNELMDRAVLVERSTSYWDRLPDSINSPNYGYSVTPSSQNTRAIIGYSGQVILESDWSQYDNPPIALPPEFLPQGN